MPDATWNQWTPERAQEVAGDLATAAVAFVITWSDSSRAAGVGYAGFLFSGLERLTAAFMNQTTARLLVDAKGSLCDNMPPSLAAWARTGRAHCLQGPNRAARESHTILRFCYEFYSRR